MEQRKKQKTEALRDPDRGFTLTFDQCGPLVMLVDIVGKILNRFHIKVIVDDANKFSGIKIASMDTSHVCYILAKLECTVTCNKGSSPELCVDAQTLVTCLKSISPHYSVDLKSDPNSCDVVISAYESISNNYFSTFNLPTLVEEDNQPSIALNAYEYDVEIDLNTLRTIVKNTISLRGEELMITLEKPTSASPYDYTIVTLQTDGNAKQKHQFHSVTETRGSGTRVIRTEEASSAELPRVEKFDVVYSEKFHINYLQKFLSCMERQIITLKLSPGKPLYMNYHLGSEACNYVCLILAPKVSD